MRILGAVDAKAMAEIHTASFDTSWDALEMSTHCAKDFCVGVGDPLAAFDLGDAFAHLNPNAQRTGAVNQVAFCFGAGIHDDRDIKPCFFCETRKAFVGQTLGHSRTDRTAAQHHPPERERQRHGGKAGNKIACHADFGERRRNADLLAQLHHPVEEAREIGGLLILVTWMAVLARKKSDRAAT